VTSITGKPKGTFWRCAKNNMETIKKPVQTGTKRWKPIRLLAGLAGHFSNSAAHLNPKDPTCRLPDAVSLAIQVSIPTRPFPRKTLRTCHGRSSGTR
jgi:hypothetical protein